MTTISANIPDYLARLVEDAAAKEKTSVDQIVAVALSSQVAAWQVRDSMEVRAARAGKGGLRSLLDAVPDVPPVEGDEK
jgi:hypothetical protein